MSLRSHALLASLALGLGCTTSASVKNTQRATSCEGASLALADDALVGTFDGAPLTYKDLGPELAEAEHKALSDYCEAVQNARAMAFNNLVTEKAATKVASAAGLSVDDWMQKEIQRRSAEATDEEIQAFYDKHKRSEAPPLDAVRTQVATAVRQEKTQSALREIIATLKKDAKIEQKLPDVRPPPKKVEIAAHTATKGKAGAKVKVVEFADFQCPYCSVAAATVRDLEKKYGDRVEFAFRNFPLKSIHANAERASQAAQCAKEQGKFWELHDKMFDAQDRLDEGSIKELAKTAGLDEAKLTECMGSGRAAEQVNADITAAMALGIEGTPTFFVNGRQAAASPEGLTEAIEAELE